MSNGEREPDFDAFDARMERLKASRTGNDDEASRPERSASSTHAGLHIGVELVAGVIGGALLGYFLDEWLGTRPFGLIALLFLGSAAGMLNAHRYIKRMERERTEGSNAPE